MLRRLFPNVYEGWLVVGSSACIVLMVAASFFYGFGTIFNEVVDEFGWSVAATSLAFSLRSEVGGIAAPFVGILVDRVGPRRVLFLGIAISTAGVVIMSEIQNLWQFYVAMVFIAVGTSAAGGQVGLVAISTWFRARRARAMAVMTLGGGMGGLLVVGVGYLVESMGWRGALRVLALLMLVVGFLAASNVRRRPRGHPQPMDGIARAGWVAGDDDVEGIDWGIPVRRVVRTPSFALLSVAMIGLAFATTSVVVHQIPYLERSLGVSKSLASTSVALFTLSSIVGRLGFGYLADRYEKRHVMAAALGLMVIGLPVLALAQELWQALAGIVLIAPGFGGTIPVRPALLADYYGTSHFGTINGVTQLVNTTGGAIGPWLVGWVVDATGAYTIGWWICAGVSLATVPVILAARPPSALIAEYRGAPGGAAG